MTASTGLIRPPMTGFNYSHNSLCVWSFSSSFSDGGRDQISAAPRTTVFKAPTVLMEKGSDYGCPYDFLKVYAGASSQINFPAATKRKRKQFLHTLLL